MFRFYCIIAACVSILFHSSSALAFEGRIYSVIIRGNETNALLYTVGTNSLRVEMTATNWPNPVDILNRTSGALTLCFPNNRTFVHLKPAADASPVPVPGAPAMPMPPGGWPAGAGPQSAPGIPAAPAMPNLPNRPALPPGVGPQSGAAPGMPAMPAMPMMAMPGEKLELQATGQKTNLLGFACEQYQIKQREETLDIWATDQLLPYQPYVQNQPHRFGPQRIEEQWGALLASRKLFPLFASLHYDNGPERFRFEVQAVTPQKLTDADTKLFQPPAGWLEIRPLPF